MRHLGAVSLGALACAMAALPVRAEDAPKTLPDTVACPKEVADIATCYSAKLETGAYLLAAMPKTWNGNLIVFAHGGPAVAPPTAKSSMGDLGKYSIGVRMGFAWVASSYRKEGYGVQMAAADTDGARKFFLDHFPKPKRTLLHGASYGGLVGSKLLETYARNADNSVNYDGAFFNSGAVGGAVLNYEFRSDLRVVYQYYCKNLPRPDEAQYPLWMGMPAESKMGLKEIAARIDECTGVAKKAEERSEAQKQNLANILNVMRIPQNMLVRHMQAATFIFRDLAQGMSKGHSAFSNMKVRYQGSADDAALNAGVERFDADPAAAAALKADGVPTGALSVPVVSIHSMNDPQAAVESQYEYRKAVTDAGHGGLLVQNYTDENVHVGQSPAEMAASLDSLMQWIEKGAKPSPQSIAAVCGQMTAKFEGPCRYHPDYQPKPYATRFARTASAQ